MTPRGENRRKNPSFCLSCDVLAIVVTIQLAVLVKDAAPDAVAVVQ